MHHTCYKISKGTLTWNIVISSISDYDQSKSSGGEICSFCLFLLDTFLITVILLAIHVKIYENLLIFLRQIFESVI